LQILFQETKNQKIRYSTSTAGHERAKVSSVNFFYLHSPRRTTKKRGKDCKKEKATGGNKDFFLRVPFSKEEKKNTN